MMIASVLYKVIYDGIEYKKTRYFLNYYKAKEFTEIHVGYKIIKESLEDIWPTHCEDCDKKE